MIEKQFEGEECGPAHTVALVSKPPPAVQHSVDGLLGRFHAAFAIAEVFWESSGRRTLTLGAGHHPPIRLEQHRGLQFRGVNAQTAVESWTTDLSGAGLALALAKLPLKRRHSSAPPPWPHDAGASPVIPAAEFERRADCLRRFMARLRPRLSPPARITAHLITEAGMCGSAAAPGKMVAWSFNRTLLQIILAPGEKNELTLTRLWSADADRSGVTVQKLGHDVVEAWARQQGRLRPPAGKMEIVLAPGGGMNFFHELVGHGLEADHVLSGASPFAKLRFGDRIALPELTVLDSPDPRFGPGALAVDDEGQPAAEVALVACGCLAGLLHDRVTAAMTGSQPTGNARRQDYRRPPEPRMRNLVVAPGPHRAEDLLAGIRCGLYAERITGRVQLQAGRFALRVEAGRLIRRGRLVGPTSEFLVLGESAAALAGIQGVGSDLQVAPEPTHCCKHGTVITGLAGPTVRLGPLEVVA